MWQILQNVKISSVAITGIQFDGISATLCHVPESVGCWCSYTLVTVDRDYHRFENPHRLQVGYSQVRVWAGLYWPSGYLYPWRGLAVYPQVFFRSLNRDQPYWPRLILLSTMSLSSQWMRQDMLKGNEFIFNPLAICMLTPFILFRLLPPGLSPLLWQGM